MIKSLTIHDSENGQTAITAVRHPSFGNMYACPICESDYIKGEMGAVCKSCGAVCVDIERGKAEI